MPDSDERQTWCSSALPFSVISHRQRSPSKRQGITLQPTFIIQEFELAASQAEMTTTEKTCRNCYLAQQARLFFWDRFQLAEMPQREAWHSDA